MGHGSTPMQWFVNGFLADFNYVHPPVKIDDQDYWKYLKHIINFASELAKMSKSKGLFSNAVTILCHAKELYYALQPFYKSPTIAMRIETAQYIPLMLPCIGHEGR